MRGVLRHHPDKPRGWRAKCLTCGARVKHRHALYCSSACVPRSVRADNCRRGRATFAYRRRAVAFRADLARLAGRVSRGELLAVLWNVYKRGYNSGWQTATNNQGQESALRDARARGAA